MIKINFISSLDKLTRVTIFSFIILLFSDIFINFEYSGISLTLFAFSMAAVALPFSEALIVFGVVCILKSLGITILPNAEIFGLFNYNLKALNYILITLGLIPIISIGIIKQYIKTTNNYISTLIGIIFSWTLYAICVPIVYVIKLGISAEGIYQPMLYYLFTKNILIHISLGVFVVTIFPAIWNKIENKRKKIRNHYQKTQ